jgi:hypothetical protein
MSGRHKYRTLFLIFMALCTRCFLCAPAFLAFNNRTQVNPEQELVAVKGDLLARSLFVYDGLNPSDSPAAKYVHYSQFEVDGNRVSFTLEFSSEDSSAPLLKGVATPLISRTSIRNLTRRGAGGRGRMLPISRLIALRGRR